MHHLTAERIQLTILTLIAHRLIRVHTQLLLILLLLLLISLLILKTDHSLLLLVIEHFIALDVAKVAHIANIAEGIVMVEASLACPVADSYFLLLFIAFMWVCLRIFMSEGFILFVSSLGFIQILAGGYLKIFSYRVYLIFHG